MLKILLVSLVIMIIPFVVSSGEAQGLTMIGKDSVIQEVPNFEYEYESPFSVVSVNDADSSKKAKKNSTNLPMIVFSRSYEDPKPAISKINTTNRVVQPQPQLSTSNVNLSGDLGDIYNRAPAKDSDKKRIAFGEISKYGWNKLHAMSIAFCESGYRSGALNHSSIEQSLGIFQINLRAWSHKIPGNNMTEKQNWLYNPVNNVSFAYNVWREQGWRPWLNCRRKVGI